MVVKDYLTKFVWIIALENKTARSVAEALVSQFMGVAGIPRVVLSDQGSEFDNQLMKQLSLVMSMNKMRTTAYNPQANGSVEVHNRTMKDQLHFFVESLDQSDWDMYLPAVGLLYNTTVNLSTGYTPYFLMYGRECRMPSFTHMVKTNLECKVDVLKEDLVYGLVKSMEEYWTITSEKVFAGSLRHNAVVRKPREFKEYEPGQEFYKIHRPTTVFKDADSKETYKISRKLLDRHVGPYRIVRKISPVLYDAEVEGKMERVHAENIRPG
jgi:hypothetical protein